MSEALSHFVDGQTRPFYFAALPLAYPALSGEYRPMTFEQTEQIEATLSKFRDSDYAKRSTAVIGVIAKQLVSWDVPNAKPTADTIRRLHPRIVNRLYFLVSGKFGEAGDAPPTEAGGEEYDEFTAELLATGEGDRAEQVEKN